MFVRYLNEFDSFNYMKDIIEEIKTEMFRRKYSIKTIQSYTWVVSRFLKWSKVEDLRKVRKSDIKEYLNSISHKAGSTINVHLNALKFLMEEILRKNCYIKIRFSKVPVKVVEFLTKDELKKLLSVIENKKHNLMIKFMYSTGMRSSELLDLKISDLDFNSNKGIIRNGKGGKSRYFAISPKIKDELFDFVKNREGYVFRTNNGRMSIRTLQEIVKKASKKAKIKNVHPHMMRHTFATHLADGNINELVLQSLMGHSDVSSTRRYTHGHSKLELKSPLDEF